MTRFQQTLFFSDTPALDDGIAGHGGCQMVQMFGGVVSHLLEALPMHNKSEFPEALKEFIRRRGAPNGLISDNAWEQVFFPKWLTSCAIVTLASIIKVSPTIRIRIRITLNAKFKMSRGQLMPQWMHQAPLLVVGFYASCSSLESSTMLPNLILGECHPSLKQPTNLWTFPSTHISNGSNRSFMATTPKLSHLHLERSLDGGLDQLKIVVMF